MRPARAAAEDRVPEALQQPLVRLRPERRQCEGAVGSDKLEGGGTYEVKVIDDYLKGWTPAGECLAGRPYRWRRGLTTLGRTIRDA